MKITPTVGRVVLFRPFDQDYDHDKRHAAIVAQVNLNGTLNLAVFNDYGVSQAEQNIVLVQGDDKPGYGQCEWMPYQKGQAAKTESVLTVDPFSDEALELALERALEARANNQRSTADSDSAFVPVSEYAKEPMDMDGEIGSVENAGDSESSEETVGLVYAAIAEACHKANHSYCESIGDDTQVPWADAPDWQRESAIKGARYTIDNLDTIKPEDSHNSWLAEKEADGWVYGEEKDVEKKTHPCFVPYNELPEEQRYKDELFIATVRDCLAEIEEK